jgi:hypothetical protein
LAKGIEKQQHEEMIDVQSSAKDKTPQPRPTKTQGSSPDKDNQTMVTQKTLPSSLTSIQVSHNELEVSGITEDSSRITLLEQQFKTITSNFTVMMEKLSKQTAKTLKINRSYTLYLSMYFINKMTQKPKPWLLHNQPGK